MCINFRLYLKYLCEIFPMTLNEDFMYGKFLNLSYYHFHVKCRMLSRVFFILVNIWSYYLLYMQSHIIHLAEINEYYDNLNDIWVFFRYIVTIINLK